MAILQLTHSMFSGQSVYTCYGLNLQSSPKLKHVRGIGQCLPEPGTKGIASASAVYFKQFDIHCWTVFSSISHLYNSKAHKDIWASQNTCGWFHGLICPSRWNTGSKGTQTKQWDSLCIRVFTIVCPLSWSLYSTWRKRPVFSWGWGNCCL